jgi:hypothetical protein
MKSGAEAAAKQHQAIEDNLKADNKKITDRVDVLERWRWMIVGGAIVLGYLVSHLELISKVFKV